MLHHHAGLPLATIAEIVGVPVGTVKSRLHYATRILRGALTRDGSLPGRCLRPPAIDESRAIEVDGHPGILATFCVDSQAFVIVDGRVYAFGIWRSGFEPLLEDFLSTVDLPG